MKTRKSLVTQLDPVSEVQPKQRFVVAIRRFSNLLQIKTENRLWQVSIYGKRKYLIKIAILKFAHPVNADRIAAY